eukprot:CAMPEP_0206549462 /NCGR_PEP_ID=MMETSP0325_2-20121206/14480_1 /ASSEMBLY_ACC=CAM_ASM_000347 /TAXON_ID=2866 /ORGANISM="Crypthecodinium cohnii, Strain Seligo" /LENGTH=123 /DNA_ID=CAMNT_0054049111 /DNA_START=41 /DNA_END=409 /DNA_ORIENTATION=+
MVKPILSSFFCTPWPSLNRSKGKPDCGSSNFACGAKCSNNWSSAEPDPLNFSAPRVGPAGLHQYVDEGSPQRSETIMVTLERKLTFGMGIEEETPQEEELVQALASELDLLLASRTSPVSVDE